MDRTGCTPLELAVNNHNQSVELLLARNANVNLSDPNGRTVLHTAAYRGYKDTAALLLANGADVNARDNNGKTPIWLAMNNKGSEDVVELLRHYGGVR
jgi:ankyrin repeat protein